MNFRMGFSISSKTIIGILTEIAWTPSVTLGSIDVFVLIHGCEVCFHLFVFSLPSFLGRASLVAQPVKSLPANVGDLSLIPRSGRSPGEGNGSLLQFSCLENPIDGGAWRTPVHRSRRVNTTE